jgi:esterase/lipase superfamily enzyme
MLISLLLATQFWIMSDRGSFWDADKISDHTEFVTDSNSENPLDGEHIKGKNVLLLVHGYNNDAKHALSKYLLIHNHVSAFMDMEQSRFYDLVIGYLWPGYDDRWEYYEAEHNAEKLSQTMRSHLESLSTSAAKVDILAHSMGNRLILEALNYPSSNTRKVVQNYYALAAAVGDESLEKKQTYYPSTENCEKIFVFFSKRDELLKWGYTLAELETALGYDGAKDPNKLPQNVQLLDCTTLVGGHNEYFTVLPIYEFIKHQFLPHRTFDLNSLSEERPNP